MSSVAEPEVLFAQKLASNDKPTRRKALKKLRCYISARSRTQTGFSEEELLKLWKGLFYCLWMQDKLLLQEELSTQISGLVHHFHSFSAQLLFFRTFLSTVNREWTGIDRLRMDKFFQLVRFVFRQMFVLLQKSHWEPSCVGQFLELLSSELLHAGAPPVGLQLHVLDLYLTELAVVGASELTADQNLVFIQPFMKTAAKTKDRVMFRAVCSSIFGTIIDQAPFAIQELLEELEQDSDSGRASEDQEEPEENLKAPRRAPLNGTKAHSEEDDEEEDVGLPDSQPPFDEDVGPILQFDYGAVADKLLELSGRGNIPSRNRQRLYKIIRVLRDLSQGSFPQDEYPEEVSTDEDDDDFGSRKRMKRKRTEEEEPEPEQKMAKGKKKKKPLMPSTESNSAGNGEAKKKKRKKKKKSASQTDSAPEVEPQVQPQVKSEDQPEPEKPSQDDNTLITTQQLKKKKIRKKAKNSEGLNEEQKNGPTVEHCEQTSSTAPEAPPTETHEHKTEEGSERSSQEPDDATQTTQKKKNKVIGNSEAVVQHQEVNMETLAEDVVQTESKKLKKKAKERATYALDMAAEDTLLQSESPAPKMSVKRRKDAAGLPQPNPEEVPATKKRKKKKIPVEFEYEVEEAKAEEVAVTPSEPSQTPLSSRLQKLQGNRRAQPEFVSFQSSMAPAPLFCRLLCGQTKNHSPKSDSKKVRFGLKNNKTAEFRRTDQSLLLSPEGPSRVPFDPDQKPKCGVLKSPPTPAPKHKKKSVCSRPTAADFF